jgi:hypothetical protein
MADAAASPTAVLDMLTRLEALGIRQKAGQQRRQLDPTVPVFRAS